MSRNDFSERDLIPLFNVYKKYLPERSYLSENLLKKGSLDKDMVTICILRERTVYYPGIAPEEGCCLIYKKSILE
ncbi:uncharacterized protein N7518_009099 [Penicillium psychrosexuale]|uniref:uncharacterized protein n=1 Tax=Penicillium psychrosexuale TaxID=1002107 RepID=UPI00254500FF|nr:uncharacterized protein N7518_009099 [Penicillium psychrosexuale]KAJ5783422.1 hypothetical protein N7518_009099 [Penicillium psychrosexuale]